MASFRIPFVILGVWFFDLFLLPLFPFLKGKVDLLLLVLIFLGFRLSSSRFLWCYGLGLGLLKDLSTGGFFGAWSCTFALIGWILSATRHLLEREDPLVLGIWAGVLAALSGAGYECLVLAVDPVTSWSGWWKGLPWVVLLHGGIAMWGFPKLQKLLSG